jgi:hypothetical protein
MPSTKQWGTGSTQDRQVPDEDPGRGVPHEAGPTGAAPESSELEGDRDANDDTRNAQGGAMGGALAGMAIAGPIGSAVGAAVGGAAGAAAGVADDDAGDGPPVESPGREPHEPYGHEIEVRGPGRSVGDPT